MKTNPPTIAQTILNDNSNKAIGDFLLTNDFLNEHMNYYRLHSCHSSFSYKLT